MLRILFLCFGLIFAGIADAQRDTTLQEDSVQAQQALLPADTMPMQAYALALADSIRIADSLAQLLPVLPVKDTSTYAKWMIHPLLPLQKAALWKIDDPKISNGKDGLFYLLTGLFALLAFIRVAFGRYFSNLFALLFQASFRQKQTREQMAQDNLASLFLNILFFASGGLYITLLVQYYHWSDAGFWWLFMLCALTLMGVYSIKFLFLRFTGWAFQADQAASTYAFVVFLINKIAGVLLLPIVLVMSFSSRGMQDVALGLASGLLILLFLYRYFISAGNLRNILKVNFLHFSLYLCAVEILPLLLIYKVLVSYVAGTL